MSAKKPERWIEIPRWREFQHYRDRRPPWIKDYLRQDRSPDYLELSLSQRGLLHGLRRLYAEWDGVVSESAARQVLVGSESDARYYRVHLERLNDAGFIRILASKPLALENREQKPQAGSR